MGSYNQHQQYVHSKQSTPHEAVALYPWSHGRTQVSSWRRLTDINASLWATKIMNDFTITTTLLYFNINFCMQCNIVGVWRSRTRQCSQTSMSWPCRTARGRSCCSSTYSHCTCESTVDGRSPGVVSSDFGGADETWRITAPKKVISRLYYYND